MTNKLSNWRSVPSFAKEVNRRLAKRPLVFNGRLANRWLTSLVKEAIVFTRVLAFGYCRYLRVSVCPSIMSLSVRKLDTSSSLNHQIWTKNAKYFAQGPYCFWDWLGLTFQVKFNFIEKFCLFASLLHLWNICKTCLSNCSTSLMAPHTLSDYNMPPNRVTS